MLRLYHYWSSVCSQKVRMCLAEKRVAWENVHVDIFAFDNYTEWYTKLNPKAVVPTPGALRGYVQASGGEFSDKRPWRVGRRIWRRPEGIWEG